MALTLRVLGFLVLLEYAHCRETPTSGVQSVPQGHLEHIYYNCEPHLRRRPMTAKVTRVLLPPPVPDNETYLFHHWLEYGRRYEAHLPHPNGQSLKLLELGVQAGGSVNVWKQYYGSSLTYVGVDVNPGCKRSQKVSDRRYIEIGSQLDPEFLLSVCTKHGPFDIIIDDGAHSAQAIHGSLAALVPDRRCSKEGTWYVIEDTHTMARCAMKNIHGKDCDKFTDIANVAMYAFAGLHRHFMKDPRAKNLANQRVSMRASELPRWTRHVAEMHGYATVHVPPSHATTDRQMSPGGPLLSPRDAATTPCSSCAWA